MGKGGFFAGLLLAGLGVLAAAGLTAEPERLAWDNGGVVGRAGDAGPYGVVEVFGGHDFHMPVAIRPVPRGEDGRDDRAGRVMIVELRGRARTIDMSEPGAEPDVMLDLELGDPAEGGSIWGWEGHLHAVAFEPTWPERPFVYVYYNVRTDEGKMNRLSRFRTNANGPPRVDDASERILLTWPSNGHNGGDVHFGPDGMLYVSTGDGAAPRDPENIGQEVDNLLGSILRLDVRVDESQDPPYRVPEDNPFVDEAGVRPEVWAYGLRNPWRMGFDPEGRLWVGDNGEESWELLHRIERGANYGWSAFEGSHAFRPEQPLGGPTRELTPPMVEHPHTEARSIVGGRMYRGERHTELRGHYIYGDYATRRVWALRWDEDEGDVTEHRLLSNTGHQILTFGEDHAGTLYIGTAEGKILQLRRREQQEEGAGAFPQKLSETGLFASTAAHEPAAGVIEYEVNAPAWRDGARGERLLAMPKGGRFQRDQQGQWNLPDGAAAAITLSLPMERDEDGAAGDWRRIETRLIHRDGGVWHFHTYRWNADQTDAELVEAEGESASYATVDRRSGEAETVRWRYHARAECASCHVREAGLTLGLNPRQLNRAGPGGVNQLERFDALRLLFINDASPEAHPRHVDPRDEAEPVDERARAYLAANCAHCHREGGAGGRAAFDARADLSLAEMGLVGVKAQLPVHTGPDGRLVEPGDAAASELHQRVAAEHLSPMPPLGRSRVDREAVELLRRWIEQLEPGDGEASR